MGHILLAEVFADDLTVIENFRRRANYMLCLVIGAYCEAIGLVLRVALRNNPESTGLYIVMYLFVVLSVSPFISGSAR